MTGDNRSSAPHPRALWIDLVVLMVLATLGMAVLQVGIEWRAPLRETVSIDLSPWALLRYTIFSLSRGWIAYGFSLIFTLIYASWMYYDLRARRFMLPMLDILQSIPVLTFLPGLVLALVGLFPKSNFGLELACVLMIFTGQVWNMTFSYYDSLRAIPPDYYALGRLYHFNWWHRFLKIELPFGAQGLLYNSMVSMAGGWFFLTINEAFQLGEGKDYRLPGIGSYMKVAIDEGNIPAQFYAVIAMGVMIIGVDRLIWWPLVVWSRKFKLDDFTSGTPEKSPFSLWLARSAIVQKMTQSFQRFFSTLARRGKPAPVAAAVVKEVHVSKVTRALYSIVILVTVSITLFGALKLVALLAKISIHDWGQILEFACMTFGRVIAATVLGLVWTIPAGVWIGLNPNMAKKLQPLIQFCASFPMPMIYPWVVGAVFFLGGNLQWGAIFLILLGTQWYLLFNIAAAAAAIPNEILSAADIMRLKGWTRWRKFLLPAIFPGLVTGLITAVGGAWNATIVSEIVKIKDQTYTATGLGALISKATDDADFSKLAAASLVMSLFVVGVNRTVWKRLQHFANERCRFGT